MSFMLKPRNAVLTLLLLVVYSIVHYDQFKYAEDEQLMELTIKIRRKEYRVTLLCK